MADIQKPLKSNDLIVIDDDSTDDDDGDCEEIPPNRRNSNDSDDVLFVGGSAGWKSCHRSEGGKQNTGVDHGKRAIKTRVIPDGILSDINSILDDDLLMPSSNNTDDLPSSGFSDTTASDDDEDKFKAANDRPSAYPGRGLSDLVPQSISPGNVNNFQHVEDANSTANRTSLRDCISSLASSKSKRCALSLSDPELLGQDTLNRCDRMKQSVNRRSSTSDSRRAKKKLKIAKIPVPVTDLNLFDGPSTSRNAVAESGSGSVRDCLQELDCIAVLDDGDDVFSSRVESASVDDDDDIQMISHVRPRKRPVPPPICVLTEDDKELSGCASCFSMFARSSMVACPFGHYSCIKCLEYQIKALVVQSTKDTLKCFMARCNNEYPMGELRKFLPPLVLDILDENRSRVNPTEANDTQNTTVPLPTYWSMMEDEPVDFVHVPLTSQSSEYTDIATRFETTMRIYRPQIVSIKRVQNRHLWEFYAIKKKQMEKDSGCFVTEERLFHGTSSRLVDVICRENFDWRLAGTHGTAYGQGSYFARDASYSHGYTDARDGGQAAMLRLPTSGRRGHAHGFVSFMTPSLSMPMNLFGVGAQNFALGSAMFNPLTVPPMPAHFHPGNGSGSGNGGAATGPILTMFMARVLVGRYCAGNPSFRRPPNINPADSLHGRKYDSCVDNVHNPSIYVIFDTAQCYPEYTIEYRVNVS